MGTSKPLTIGLDFRLTQEAWVQLLRDKGHHIFPVVSLAASDNARPINEVDLFLGPNCARFVPGMEKFLNSFLAGARKIKYPSKEKTNA